MTPISEPDVVVAGFRLLLAEGRPITIGELAAALDTDDQTTAVVLAKLDGRGWVRRDDQGRLVGSAGLSVVPSRHEIRIGERRFWTWCAYDALGILGALKADGTVITASPATGEPIEVGFREGRPQRHDLALFRAQMWNCASVEEEYCPLVNLFENTDDASAWAAETGREGEILGIDEATDQGTGEWLPLLTPGAADRLQANPGNDCR